MHDLMRRSERRLTITYGVDAGAPRTVSLPVRRASALLAVVVAAVVWTVASTIYLSAHGVAVLVTGAPPSAGNVASASVAATLPQATAEPTAPVVVQPPQSRTDTLPEPLPESLPEPASEAPSALATVAESVPPALPARLDGIAVERSAAGMSVRFGLVNLGEDTIAGEITGTATFRTDAGTQFEVAADEVRTFSARIRTQKTLRFVAPSGIAGAFTDVRIVAKDVGDGGRELTAAYDLAAGAAPR